MTTVVLEPGARPPAQGGAEVTKADIVECVAEVVEPTELGFVAKAKPQPVEPVKPVILRETDFVWHPELRAFMPVFGSVHGDRALDASRTLPETPAWKKKTNALGNIVAKLRGENSK